MIPQRVQLRGFLCYKDEQEISFDGASLWLLAGLNGSGKSSIFDAIRLRGGDGKDHSFADVFVRPEDQLDIVALRT